MNIMLLSNANNNKNTVQSITLVAEVAVNEINFRHYIVLFLLRLKLVYLSLGFSVATKIKITDRVTDQKFCRIFLH